MTSSYPVPTHEEERLRQLRALVVLDTPPEAVFDSIARLAAEICGVPIALLSLVDSQRQWFKANVGLPGVNQTPRDVAFCAHAIVGEDVFEVPDASCDDRFAGNPLVIAEPAIRFYAGAPLRLPGGETVGALCVIDRQPRKLDARQLHELRALAQLVTQALLMRRDLIDRTLAIRADYERRITEREAHFRGIVEQQSELVSLARPDGELVYVNPAYARHFGLKAQQMVGRNLFDYVGSGDQEAVRRQVAEVLASGTSASGENRTRLADSSERWVAWTNHRQLDPRGRTMLHSVGRDVTDRKRLEQRLIDGERFVRLVTDNVPVRIAYVGRDLRFRFVNRAHCLRFGLERDAIVGRTRNELTGRALDPSLNGHVAAVLGGQEQRFEYDEDAGEQRRRIEGRLIPDVDDEGQVRGFYSIGIDVTERSSIERTLRELTATLGAVIEAIPAIVAVLGADGRYRYVNRAFERWVGSSRQDIVGRSLAEVLGPAEFERSRPFAEQALQGETVSFDKAYPDRGGGSHLAISFVPLWLDNGVVDGFVSVAQDITHHKREEVRLLQLSQRDSLTGLLNRLGFEERLNQWQQAEHGEAMALLYIDLDRFKAVNDSHGHTVGDELLRLFAQRLQALVRPSDAVARLGGDEFAIALPGVSDPAIANRVAEKVVRAGAAPFGVGALRLEVGASIGVAIASEAERQWSDLVARADEALYGAKAEGRGRWLGASEWASLPTLGAFKTRT